MAAASRPARTPWHGCLPARPVAVWLLIAGVATVGYANTLHASFHFDDAANITESARIRHLADFRDLSGTRYVGFLTFALNYAVGGVDPVGYHVVNLLIHIISGGLVYSLVALLFSTPRMQTGRGADLSPQDQGAALATALLFVAHPIQTQAVTYVVQRFTSLAALFYLLAVVSYLRWRLADSPTPIRYGWYAGALVAALAAMKTKEHTFTLPLMLLLAEWVGFGLRPWLKWRSLLPFVLLLPVIPLSLSAGPGIAGGDLGMARETTEIGRLGYFATQCRVLVTYLRLMVWPVGQNVDYDYPIAESLWEPTVLASGLCLSGLLGLAVFLLWARTKARLVGFGVVWFFLTVSVESSIIPIRDVIFEHRMYLPSVGLLLAGSVLGARLLAGWPIARVVVLVALVGVFVGASYQRNRVWADEMTLWRDVVAKSPQKARAHTNLGRAYLIQGQRHEAMAELSTALRLDPDFPEAHMNLGIAYARQGQVDEAIQAYQVFLRFRPDHPIAHFNLGLAYAEQGQVEAAIQEYQTALRLAPDYTDAHMNLGMTYARRGNLEAAIREYEAGLRLRPDSADVHYNLANAYLAQGRRDEAIREYRTALSLKTDLPEAHVNLGNAYAQQGQAEAAIQEYRAAIGLEPSLPEPHNNLGSTYLGLGRLEEAGEEFHAALRLRPAYLDAQYNLGIARLRQGRRDEATQAFLASLRLRPDFPEAEAKLGAVYAQQRSWDAAIVHYQRALQQRPDWVDQRFALAEVYLSKGASANARREFEAVLRIRPDFAPAQQRLKQLDGGT